MGRLFLAFLAVAWACVLIPAGLRRRPERGSFSLLGLGESVAGLASRRRSRSSMSRGVPVWSPSAGYDGGPVPPIARSWGESVRPGGRPNVPGLPGGRPLPGPRPFGRPTRRNVRRQRQIVVFLASSIVVSLLLSFVPGLRALLALTLVATVLLAVYVVALLRLKAGISPSLGQGGFGQGSSGRDGSDPFWGPSRNASAYGVHDDLDGRVYARAVGE